MNFLANELLEMFAELGNTWVRISLCFLAEFQILKGIFMATKHLGIKRHLRDHVHCVKHLISSALEEAAAASDEHRVTSEHASIDSSSDLVACIDLSSEF